MNEIILYLLRFLFLFETIKTKSILVRRFFSNERQHRMIEYDDIHRLTRIIIH